MAKSRFEYLCRPGKIGPVEVKNRMVMAPHSPNSAGPHGEVGDLLLEYLEERARGGAGLIIVEDTMVVPPDKWGAGITHQPEIWDIKLVDGWKRLVDAIHFWGAKAAIQLNWPGVRIDNTIFTDVQPPGPSVIQVPGWSSVQKVAAPGMRRRFATTRAVTIDEIEWMEDQFVMGAVCAVRAGFDVVMLHCAQGYGIASFSSPFCNHRNDLYGGSFENRMRFGLDITKKVRAVLTPEMALIVRVSVDEFVPGGVDRAEGIRIAKAYESAGVDAIHLSCGLFTTQKTIQPIYYPRAFLEPYLPEMRKAIKVPLSVAGSLNNPEDAERILRDYKLDFVDLGRVLIADPDYPNKVMEGRPEDIRICTRCCECIHSIVANYSAVECSVNVEAGREARTRLIPASKPKKVVVVGGGPAGMEAARVAALRGHKVTLYDKNDRLGGNLIAAAVPDFKDEYKWLISWFAHQLDKLGVEVKLGKAVTAAEIARLKPDAAVVATGAVSCIPGDISGVNKAVTAVDVLLGKARVGQQVVVVGGGLIGCDTALHLAQKGKQVTIIEMREEIAHDTLVINRRVLLEKFAENKVNCVTSTKVTEIGRGAVQGINLATGALVSYPTDSVVLAVGLVPVQGLAEGLKGKVPEVYAVGDCVKARKAKEAIYEGSMVARRI